MKNILLHSLILLTPVVASAQVEAKYEGPREAAKDATNEAVYKASGQLGAILTTGNADTRTIIGKIEGSRTTKKLMLSGEAGITNARSTIITANDANGNGTIDGENEIDRVGQTTAEEWYGKARGDYFLSERLSVWGAARIGANPIAGKELYYGGQIGVAYLVHKSEKYSLRAELGYDYTHEDFVAPGADSIDSHSARGWLGGDAKLSDDTGMKAYAEALVNLNEYDLAGTTLALGDDLRVNAGIELNTKIRGNISFSFGFDVKYDKAPAPRPAFDGLPYAAGFLPVAETVDTVTKATLIITFL